MGVNEPVRPTHPPLGTLIEPKRCALIAIDVQHHFLADDRAVNVAGFLSTLRKLLAEARRVGALRVFVRAVENPDRNTAAWLSRHASKPHRLGNYEGSPSSEFMPGIRPEATDVVITKHRYNAFLGTGLDTLLRSRGIDTLIFTGVQSNVCVELSASDAFQRDFWTVIVEDATTTADPERHAQAMRDAVNHWGRVVKASEILAAWNGRV